MNRLTAYRILSVIVILWYGAKLLGEYGYSSIAQQLPSFIGVGLVLIFVGFLVFRKNYKKIHTEFRNVDYLLGIALISMGLILFAQT